MFSDASVKKSVLNEREPQKKLEVTKMTEILISKKLAKEFAIELFDEIIRGVQAEKEMKEKANKEAEKFNKSKS